MRNTICIISRHLAADCRREWYQSGLVSLVLSQLFQAQSTFTLPRCRIWITTLISWLDNVYMCWGNMNICKHVKYQWHSTWCGTTWYLSLLVWHYVPSPDTQCPMTSYIPSLQSAAQIGVNHVSLESGKRNTLQINPAQSVVTPGRREVPNHSMLSST